MSGELLARDAAIAALRANPALAPLVNQISDGDPGKASAPWLRVGEASVTAWGARDVHGRTVRFPVQLQLRGDALAPVVEIVGLVDEILSDFSASIDPWRATHARLERSRIVRNQAGWSVTMDYLVRIARAG